MLRLTRSAYATKRATCRTRARPQRAEQSPAEGERPQTRAGRRGCGLTLAPSYRSSWPGSLHLQKENGAAGRRGDLPKDGGDVPKPEVADCQSLLRQHISPLLPSEWTYLCGRTAARQAEGLRPALPPACLLPACCPRGTASSATCNAAAGCSSQ